MKKKKLIGIVLATALVLSVGVVVYAETGGFTMTYLPGTADTVSNMPANDSGVGGQPYTVSDKIPQREGYEFLGWRLDYEKVPTVQYMNYTVSYIDIETGEKIISDEVREHCEIGSTQTALIPNVAGYMFEIPSGGESDGRTVTFKIEDDLIYDPITGYRIELYYQYT